ncbi:hypothetical protein GGX14DRAFT_594200 [Mycena pura]|uniref:Uncharacterized protein n=1 Tax=Mycena pura TaxID=153505 RepID=A0AAD6UQS0_9AGAR|nr:hypothetical protein GGX14DRAFT_594200 [Mycena pura]
MRSLQRHWRPPLATGYRRPLALVVVDGRCFPLSLHQQPIPVVFVERARDCIRRVCDHKVQLHQLAATPVVGSESTRPWRSAKDKAIEVAGAWFLCQLCALSCGPGPAYSYQVCKHAALRRPPSKEPASDSGIREHSVDNSAVQLIKGRQDNPADLDMLDNEPMLRRRSQMTWTTTKRASAATSTIAVPQAAPLTALAMSAIPCRSPSRISDNLNDGDPALKALPFAPAMDSRSERTARIVRRRAALSAGTRARRHVPAKHADELRHRAAAPGVVPDARAVAAGLDLECEVGGRRGLGGGLPDDLLRVERIRRAARAVFAVEAPNGAGIILPAAEVTGITAGECKRD